MRRTTKMLGTAALIAVTALQLGTARASADDENSGDGDHVQQTAAPPQITAQPALYPSFSATVYNYVTRCSNAPVHVSVDAPSGTTVRVDGAHARSGQFTADVPLSEGQAFSFVVRGNDSATTYSVRCLPADFPNWTATRSGTPQAAYYIVTPSLPGYNDPWVAVYDNNGVPRWWMKSPQNPIDAKLLPNGTIGWIHADSGAPYISYRIDGQQARSYGAASPSDFIDHHDLKVLPNGNYFLATDVHVPADLSSCGGPVNGTMVDHQVQELSATGKLLWSWTASQHIPLSESSPKWKAQCAAGDPYHYNALQPVGNDILISFRHLDAVYDVSLGTGAIQWKLGGTTRTDGTSLTVANDPVFAAGDTIGGQHDVRVLPDGTITLFDNGTGHNRAPRAVRYSIDAQHHTATLVEQAGDPSITFSGCCGSARKLAAGDWVMSFGGAGGGFKIEELAPGNSIVFSLQFAGLFSYRVDPVSFGGSSRVLDAGMNQMFPRSRA